MIRKVSISEFVYSVTVLVSVLYLLLFFYHKLIEPLNITFSTLLAVSIINIIIYTLYFLVRKSINSSVNDENK